MCCKIFICNAQRDATHTTFFPEKVELCSSSVARESLSKLGSPLAAPSVHDSAIQVNLMAFAAPSVV